MPGFENDVLLCSNVNFNTGLANPHPGLITTNGQLIIGTTVLNAGGTHLNIGNIVSPGGTISVGYNSPNITLEVMGGQTPVISFDVDYAPISTLPPTASGLVVPNPVGQVSIEGRHNVVVEQQTATPNNFEMRLYSPYWFEVTGISVSAANARPNFGYITNNGSLVTVNLPTTAAVGQTFHICGKGTGGWQIAQSAGQQIHFGTLDTTSGATGHLDSTSQYDAITLVCTVANNEFTVVHSQGTISVT